MDASWLSLIILGCLVYVAVALAIMVIGSILWGNDPKTKAKLEDWRRSREQDLSLLGKGVGLGRSVIGLPLGLMVDALVRLRKPSSRSLDSSRTGDDTRAGGPNDTPT